MNAIGIARPYGHLRLSRSRVDAVAQLFNEFTQHCVPREGLPDVVNANRWRRWMPVAKSLLRYATLTKLRLPFFMGKLHVVVFRLDGAVEDYGLVSMRVVTNNGVAFIVDAFQNLTELENMRYHGLGTGTAAEAASDTALGSELSTQYSPDNTRATGSLTESASNVFRTVGTNTVDATVTVQEHGIFSQAATGGGTLLDRSLTGSQALNSGDGIQSTYDFTINSGG